MNGFTMRLPFCCSFKTLMLEEGEIYYDPRHNNGYIMERREGYYDLRKTHKNGEIK
jgi:hypothetical protein